MTPQSAIPNRASLPEQLSKICPKTGYAPYAV